MTAAHGIIHSEMPQQTEGRMRGFQLWINLPAREKMKPAAYRDIPAAEIPRVALAGGGEARVIAGTLQQGDVTTAGPIRDVTTSPVYLDVHLPPRAAVNLPLPVTHNAFVYVYEGAAEVGEDRQACAASRGGPAHGRRRCASWPRVQMARECWCSRARRSVSRSCSTVRS